MAKNILSHAKNFLQDKNLNKENIEGVKLTFHQYLDSLAHISDFQSIPCKQQQKENIIIPI